MGAGRSESVLESPSQTAQPKKKSTGRDRFPFIDQFRGLIGIMMALGHSSGFFNGAWKSLDMFDPLFNNWGQFGLRYMGYLCAPGFLMMNGAVSWYSYSRRRAAGATDWQAKWHLIQRGLFLILMQVTWVNMAWIAFRPAKYSPAHLGIISTIGISMCLLALLQHTRWPFRLAVGLAAFVGHTFLLRIPYSEDVVWQRVLMQTFVDAGDWNKYPVIPWFGFAALGSTMAVGWFGGWQSPRKRILMSWGIGLGAIAVAAIIRLAHGWGNSTDYYRFFHISFFLDSKYPPNLYHNLWFFGAVSFMVGTMHLIGQFAMPLIRWLGGIGRVPFFFYCMHISLLAIVADRLGVYYRQGAVTASFVGWVALLLVMYPLSLWFWGLKQRHKNKLLQMI